MATEPGGSDPAGAEPAPLLLLGGTTEASALATRLAVTDGVAVTTSLAGRTATPKALPGRVRTGGFGGADGLARWLRDERVAAVVDATHPFAAHMPWHAVDACAVAGVPRLRLCRPGWTPTAGDRWTVVADLVAAAAAVHDLGARRVFLTTGRRQLAPFARLDDVWFLVRSVDPPEHMPLRRAEVLLDMGPFDEAGEQALMEAHRIDVLVTKNSGGTATAAKIVTARRLGIPVVMVARPPAPPAPTARTMDEALAWCVATLGLTPGVDPAASPTGTTAPA